MFFSQSDMEAFCVQVSFGVGDNEVQVEPDHEDFNLYLFSFFFGSSSEINGRKMNSIKKQELWRRKRKLRSTEKSIM